VYRATVLNPVAGLAAGTVVAMKTGDESFAHERAIQAEAFARCPNFVAQPYEHGATGKMGPLAGDPYFLTMELGGGTLTALRRNHLNEFCAHRQALWTSLHDALQCLQQNNIYHFDIKVRPCSPTHRWLCLRACSLKMDGAVSCEL
jgi:hypothetical protein